MQTKEIKNSTVELIYAYFESLDDEKRNKKYKNFAINFTERFTIVYDFKEHCIKIDRNVQGTLKGFWSVNGERLNVMDMTLILGENGIGKTTLLRALAACATENIESDMKNYVLVYYLVEMDVFFIKTTCEDLVDISDLDMAYGSGEFKNIVYEGQRKGIDVFGFYGLAEIDEQGKVVPFGKTKRVSNLAAAQETWKETLPMECFYLPVISDKNSMRFIERKKILNVINDVDNIDIMKFLIMDYQKGGESFLKEYPKLFIRSTSIKQVRENENFSEYAGRLFELINMGSWKYTRRKKVKFRVNYDAYYENDSVCKKIFFICVLVQFLVRLSVGHQKENGHAKLFERIEIELKRAMKAKRKQTDIDAVYAIVCGITKKVLGIYYRNYRERFVEILEAIEVIPKCYFRKESLFINQNIAYCKLDVEEIAENGADEFIDFLQKVHGFERDMKTNEETFAFLKLTFNEMSTGEYSLIRDVFARIEALKKNVKESQKKKSILLILDEPDMSFHLRWTQSFVYNLVRNLERLYPNNKFQVILTSHMPFMVTDFPKKSIVCLSELEWRELHKDEEFDWVDGYKFENSDIRGFHPKNGFMCNYYDILRDAFFIDVPIGEFAQFKYRKLNEEIDALEGEISKEQLDDLQTRINIIDEQLLRKMLQDKLDKCKTKETRLYELQQEVERLQNLIQEMENVES